MTRYDAVNYISHGIAKRPGLSESRPVRGVEKRRRQGGGDEPRRRATRSRLLHQLNKKRGRQDRSADRRDAEINRTIQVLCRRQKNNPLFVGEAGVARPRSRRPGTPHHSRRSAGGTQERHRVRARHGHAGSPARAIAATSRSASAGDQEIEAYPGRDHVHRRDPHRDRRRRHLGRRHGRVEPAQAALASGTIRCVGSTTTRNTASISRRIARCATLHEDRRQRAVGAGCDRDPQGLKPYFEEYHKLKYTNEAIKARSNCRRATSMTRKAAGTRRST